MVTINFGGLTFEGDPTSGYGLVDLTGWYDAAPARSEPRNRPQADGAFGINKFYRDPRVIGVTGDWAGPDLNTAFAARDTLAALQASGLPSTFTVTDNLGTRSCTVTLASSPQIPAKMISPYFTFSFQVVATDPNKYGSTAAPFTGLPVAGTGFVWPAVSPFDWGSGGDPGRVTATNGGTAATYPVLEVVGGIVGGVELVELTTGSYLRLERDIPATSTIFFNTRTGRAYENIPANDISGFLTRRDWAGFAIPAGGSRTVQFNALGVTSGTPKLTIRYAPAY